MFFLLCSLLSIAGEPVDMGMEVTGNQYIDILILPPEVAQDGKSVTEYDYEPLVMSKMVLSKKTANYYYDANIDGIYNLNTISVLGSKCNYKKKPFECANENDHHVLKTDIQNKRNKFLIIHLFFIINKLTFLK